MVGPGPVSHSRYGLCGCKATLNSNSSVSLFQSTVVAASVTDAIDPLSEIGSVCVDTEQGRESAERMGKKPTQLGCSDSSTSSQYFYCYY